MKIDYLGSKVGLSSGPKDVRKNGPTGSSEFQLLGEQVSMSKSPVNDFYPEASKSTFQLLGEEVPLDSKANSPYEADLSFRARLPGTPTSGPAIRRGKK
jgi:hypothetical protein